MFCDTRSVPSQGLTLRSALERLVIIWSSVAVSQLPQQLLYCSFRVLFDSNLNYLL